MATLLCLNQIKFYIPKNKICKVVRIICWKCVSNCKKNKTKQKKLLVTHQWKRKDRINTKAPVKSSCANIIAPATHTFHKNSSTTSYKEKGKTFNSSDL